MCNNTKKKQHKTQSVCLYLTEFLVSSCLCFLQFKCFDSFLLIIENSLHLLHLCPVLCSLNLRNNKMTVTFPQMSISSMSLADSSCWCIRYSSHTICRFLYSTETFQKCKWELFLLYVFFILPGVMSWKPPIFRASRFRAVLIYWIRNEPPTASVWPGNL